MLYDLNKKGTLIITIGRSGSHLLGDIISNELETNNIPYKNLLENFLQVSPTRYKAHNFYKTQLDNMINTPQYVISQIQDFSSKLWILTHGTKWLSDYHVIILKRNDPVAHFFSRQVLQKFHHVIPVHTFKGINNGTFDNLKNQLTTIDTDDVWQFYSEQQILNRFIGDNIVYYEDMCTWKQVNQSKYLKNNYKINFKDLFTNYTNIVSMISQISNV